MTVRRAGVEDLAVIGNVMLALRTLPPTHIAGRSIASAEDLLQAAPGQPSGDVLRYRLVDGSRVIVRPSGTEPKLKCYVEVVEAVRGPADLPAARQRAAAALAALTTAIGTATGL